MREEEIIQRARLAAAEMYPNIRGNIRGAILAGEWDNRFIVKAVARALRNLDKPLPVDPDEEELRGLLEKIYPMYVDADIDMVLQRGLASYKAIKAKWGARHD